MAGFFNLPPRSTKSGDSKNIKTAAKSTQVQSISIKGGGGLMDRINTISATVNAKLGKYANEYRVIRNNPQEFSDFIDLCIANGGISIDTETTGLDPIMDKLVGLCLYTPGHPAVYVPINHLSYITSTLAKDQLTEEQVKPHLQRLVDAGTFTVMFNAVFDIRVILNQVGVRLKCHFDCFVASRLLNENEPKGQGGLKALHKKYVLQGKGDAFSFGNLFSGMPFSYIPIKTAYLYAAHDAIITWELMEYQRPFLTPTDPKCIEHGLQQVAWVFENIEMPVIDSIVEMEQNGIALDKEMCDKLSKEYHQKHEEAQQRVQNVCNMYKDDIAAYRRANPGCLIKEDFNPASPAQLAILLYDILKIPAVDKDKPRGTGEDILQKIEQKTGNPLCEAILNLRGIEKLLSTYIDKIPAIACPKDGRVHCKFNQMGADTGRMSSDSPNLQNIPSRTKEIRKMFCAAPGYIMLSCDYSAQEPRLTAHLSKDEKMIKAYQEDKDVYCEIASIAFGVPYEECMEFFPDGTKNAEGKVRRNSAKQIVLGINYGRGITSIAEKLNTTKQKAQEIYDSVLQAFPGLAQFKEESEQMARDLGFVTTNWGRKRRLPNMQLPYYEFKYTEGRLPENFDPLSEDVSEISTEVPWELCNTWTNQLLNARSWKEKEGIKRNIQSQGVEIVDNGKKISDAVRQCVNSRVQGKPNRLNCPSPVNPIVQGCAA